MSRKQCKACPWRVDVVPEKDIPGGYSADKHCALKSTISDGGLNLSQQLRIMACHETPIGKEKACVGWLANQLGIGNNIALRYAVAFGRLDADVETVGEQHERLEDTLPRNRE